MSAPPPTTTTTRFDTEAASWDSNPFVQSATHAAHKALQTTIPSLSPKSSSSISILEIGCGTGLLSLLMAPTVSSLTAIDASQGMISVLESKLSKPDAPKNIHPICLMLEDAEDPALPPSSSPSSPSNTTTPRKKYDLILSHLVLHHIPTPSLSPLLRTMYNCLAPNGEIALTDYQDFGPEAKKFHPKSKMEGVERHGIDCGWMEGLIREAGFVDVDVGVGWRMEKEVERFEGEFGDKGTGGEGEGEVMEFPFLICRGRRP